jgi:hypothetical protein
MKTRVLPPPLDPVPAATPTRPFPIRLWLILVGIVLCAVNHQMTDRLLRGGPDVPYVTAFLHPAPIPPLAVNIGRIGLAIVLTGGILCAIAPVALSRARHYRVLLCFAIAYSVVLATRNLEMRDLLRYEVHSPMAPVCTAASCLLFASLNRDHWRTLIRVVALGSLGVSLLALFELMGMHSASRGEAYWRLYTYSGILEITAIVAFGWFSKVRRAWIGLIPAAVLLVVSVAMQARLMLVENLCLLGFYILFTRRGLTVNRLVTLCVASLLLMWTPYFIWYSSGVQRMLPRSVTSFWDRRAEDTRSAQFVDFFAKVPAGTFLFGTGIPRRGEFNGLGATGIDLGYVNILFLGGVPALVLFFIIHLLPALRCIGARFDSVDAACLASVLTYGVRLFSSTVPAFEPHYLLLMLLVGRCIMLSADRTARYRSRHSMGRTSRNLHTVRVTPRASECIPCTQ